MSAAVRHVCYVTGTRADFGLMVSTLHQISRHPALQLSLLVTGMHLSAQYGLTVDEVLAEGFAVRARVPCALTETTGAQMARNIGHMLGGFVDALVQNPPDVLLLLGDRGEMLAGALAAAHLGIPAVHIHGGERSGTVDEPVRHAISKLVPWHLVATEASRDRLIRMGEPGSHIRLTGAPGLDGLHALADMSRAQLCSEAGLEASRPLALWVYHPVLQEATAAGAQAALAASALLDAGYQVMALMPNADAGSQRVREALLTLRQPGRFVVSTHLSRARFVSWMACVDVMVGNSSSGIIEAASFGTPVLNLGSRQQLRERNPNVTDLPLDAAAIGQALQRLALQPRPVAGNLYGDGCAGARIAAFLAEVDLSPALQAKCNAY